MSLTQARGPSFSGDPQRTCQRRTGEGEEGGFVLLLPGLLLSDTLKHLPCEAGSAHKGKAARGEPP